jgi:hypothetical protein
VVGGEGRGGYRAAPRAIILPVTLGDRDALVAIRAQCPLTHGWSDL